MKFFTSYILLFILITNIQAQEDCSESEDPIKLIINTDDFGYETSWQFVDINGEIIAQIEELSYEDFTEYIDTICIPRSCVLFKIKDSYGDGGPSYSLENLNTGERYSGNGDFLKEDLVEIQCSEGSSCTKAQTVRTGEYSFEGNNDYWFEFNPQQHGSYNINTCKAECNTKIWIYDDCGIQLQSNNQGTIYFNDDNLNCDLSAEIPFALLSADRTYYIRVGDEFDDCVQKTIQLQILFNGPILGCTDPLSCNYNLLATVDDGSCIPQGSPLCPEGPDLWVIEDDLFNSLDLTEIESSDPCLISEGCLNGYGTRDILKFTTHIKNIGEKDFVVGKTIENSDQFSWDNCHDHFHLNSYAEYLLFDYNTGQSIPVGFKNGFCVLDLYCQPGSTPKFSCEYMGLTAGCNDVYKSDVDCQWVDITDVPDGKYILAIRINWKNKPDYLGNVEKRRDNNWAQACLELDRSSGKLMMTKDRDCPAFKDCNGQPFGDAQIDCKNNCGGGAVFGDINEDSILDLSDVLDYISDILRNQTLSNSCTDINTDGQINVYDVSLINSCLRFGAAHPHDGTSPHDHCGFPSGIFNTQQSNTLRLSNHHPFEQYFDIQILNPASDVTAFQFELSGVDLHFPPKIESLKGKVEFPVYLNASVSEPRIIGISLQDSFIHRSNEYQDLLRIYYESLNDAEICISSIAEIINIQHEQTNTIIDTSCFKTSYSSTSNIEIANLFTCFPNPFSDRLYVECNTSIYGPKSIQLYDCNGREYTIETRKNENTLVLDTNHLKAGVYILTISHEEDIFSKRIIKI